MVLSTKILHFIIYFWFDTFFGDFLNFKYCLARNFKAEINKRLSFGILWGEIDFGRPKMLAVLN